MTLKEKFGLILMEFWSSDWESKCEQEADEYAIGFAEWLYRYDNTRLPNGNWIIKLGLKPYTSEEVLEIYKKEKGLI
jgi:hypothetical protein